MARIDTTGLSTAGQDRTLGLSPDKGRHAARRTAAPTAVGTRRAAGDAAAVGNSSAPGFPSPSAARVTATHQLVGLAETVGRESAAAIAAVDLTPTQYAVLSWADTVEPLHQRALAEAVGIDPADLVGHLDHLQSLKLITRERDPRDRRRQIVSTTRSGSLALDHAERLLAQTFRRLLSGLDAEQHATFAQLLSVLDDDRPADPA